MIRTLSWFSIRIACAASIVGIGSASAAVSFSPLPWLEQKVVAGANPPFGNFGRSVAISGSMAIVGAPQTTVDGHSYQGAAYVFTETGGVWTLQQTLSASDGAENNQFGTSVGIDNGVAMVGAQSAAVDGHAYQGAVYVFTQSGDAWTQIQKLTASDGGINGDFGGALALKGSVAIVGAYNTTVDGAANRGEVYVFAASGGTWTQVQQLLASDGVDGDQFGHAVALDGTTAVISAWSATIDGNLSEGAAYVFANAGAHWSETQKLVASDGAANDEFGRAVAVAGTTALIGSAYATIDANPNQGAVYAFTATDGTWKPTQKLVASDGAANDSCGYTIAIDGGTAVIGANGATIGATACEGAAYGLALADAQWSEQQKLTESDGEGCDFFGYSVGLSGPVALVGAELAGVDGTSGAGAAYFYTRPVDDVIFANGFDSPR